jgi:PEP-CTERM motif
MFKKLKYLLFVGVMLACLMPVVAGAYSIDSSFATPADDLDGYTSPYVGVQVETFENAPSFLWTWYGNGIITYDSEPNLYAAPYGQGAADSTYYLSVPYSFAQEFGDPVVTATDFGTANYLGLWWGSIDAYNTITFYNGNAIVLSFTGADVITLGASYGDQITAGSNHYVNFRDLPDFNTVTFSSSQFAFEADNIAIGVVGVPEPATMLLLGLGLLGLAGVRRKIKK